MAFNSTGANPGGGIAGVGSLTFESTIVAKNIGSPSDIVGFVSAYHSLIGNTSGATITGSNNVLNVNPLLGPLANNGGPTLTHALLLGSPATKWVELGSLTTDRAARAFPDLRRPRTFGAV